MSTYIMKEILTEWRKYLAEEQEPLNEIELPSWASKIVYAPARAMSAVERAVRKKTGIRGVADPSVITDADGKLIVPPPSKLKQWQKDHPAWYAAAQAASNVTAGDPVGMLATIAGGGLAAKGAKAAKQAIRGLKAVKRAKLTKANIATKTTPKTPAAKPTVAKAPATPKLSAEGEKFMAGYETFMKTGKRQIETGRRQIQTLRKKLQDPNLTPQIRNQTEKMIQASERTIAKLQKHMNKVTKHAEKVRKYGDPQKAIASVKAKGKAEIDRLKKHSKMSFEDIMLDNAKALRAKGMTKQADEIEKIIKTGMEKTAARGAQTAKSAASHKQLTARMQKAIADFKAGKIGNKEFIANVKELQKAIIDNPASTPQTKQFIKNYVDDAIKRWSGSGDYQTMARSAAKHKETMAKGEKLLARMKQGVADFKAGKIDRKEFHGQVKELGQAIIDNPASTPQTKEFIKNYVASIVNK